MDVDERDDLVSTYGAGELDGLVSCDLLLEGFDIPADSKINPMVAIDLRATKSLGLHLQKLGRVLRPFPGKTKAIILDHVGNCMRHGAPDEDREWSLESGVVKRSPAREAEIKLRQCPWCFFTHLWAQSCPQCGMQYPIKCKEQPVETDGELELITPQERDLLLQSARTLADFHNIAKKSGYKPGWAFHKWKNRKQRNERVTA
jgi:superfamily II DNA or RNA helicase